MRKRYNKNTPRKRRTKKGTIRGRSKRSKRTNKKRLSKRNRRQRGGTEEFKVMLSEGNKYVKCRVLKIIDTTQDTAAEKKGVTLDFFVEGEAGVPRTSIPLSQVSNCTFKAAGAKLGPSVEVTGVYSDTNPHPDLTITPVTSCERRSKSRLGGRWGDDTAARPTDPDPAKNLAALIQDKKEVAKDADRNALLGAEGSAKAPWATAPGRQHM